MKSRHYIDARSLAQLETMLKSQPHNLTYDGGAEGHYALLTSKPSVVYSRIYDVGTVGGMVCITLHFDGRADGVGNYFNVSDKGFILLGHINPNFRKFLFDLDRRRYGQLHQESKAQGAQSPCRAED